MYYSLRTLVLVSGLLFGGTLHGQAIKRQIGKSVWIRNGKEIIDSTVAFIMTFDRQNRKTSEWKVFQDSAWKLADTSYVELDTAGRLTYYDAYGWRIYYEYDSKGIKKRMKTVWEKDTSRKYLNSDMSYQSFYDNDGRLIKLHGTAADGSFSITTYKYRQNSIVESTESGTRTIVRNDRNQVVFDETVTMIDGKVYSSEKLFYNFDDNGLLREYIKITDGKTIKKTFHFYLNGREIYQVEEFYDHAYKVVTTFTYEYW